MKFLHTSDWHLGVTMKGASCAEEHRRFLDWLVDTIIAKQVDALIVAGDIFHRDQPPARALGLYYRFLAQCAAATDLSQIIIVGGNHDSPSRLEAPAEVLSALDVHVVGGLMAEEETWERCLCPVRAVDTGEVEAVVAAVPYVQEAKLGIVTTSASEAEIRRQYTERFSHLYGYLAELAAERYPDAPLIGTGHLTCETKSSRVKADDFNDDIHQVGTISGLPPSIFGDGYDYVALGHIHRMFPIGDSRAWYSGTPVATSQTEASTRYVLIGETERREDDGAVAVEKVEVPCWRQISQLRGAPDEISAQIRQLPAQPELVPYLFIDVEIDGVDQMYEMRDRFDRLIKDTFEEGFRPRIVERREHLAQAAAEQATDEEAADYPSLDELSPEDVFERLFADAHGGHAPDDKYMVAFRYLVQTSTSNDFDAGDAPSLLDDEVDDGADADATGTDEPDETAETPTEAVPAGEAL